MRYDAMGQLIAYDRSDYATDGVTVTGTSSSTYDYGADGMRIRQSVDGITSLNLNDPMNPTGYSQILEEGTDADGDGRLDVAEIERVYTLAADVAVQAEAVGNTYALLTDAHGSNRAVLDLDALTTVEDATLSQRYAFDAYGKQLSGLNLTDADAPTLTALLYSGERTDAATGQQYLRARYYDVGTGVFTTLDPFVGDAATPRTWHNYAYSIGDPINFNDPSGEVFNAVLTIADSYLTGLDFAAEAVIQGRDPFAGYVHGIGFTLAMNAAFSVAIPLIGAALGPVYGAAKHLGWRASIRSVASPN